MEGMTWASVKKNPSLIPLYGCIFAGSAMALAYTLRLAFKNPDVQWNRNKNPNEEYREKPYKFINQHIDWSTYKNPAPVYDKPE